MEEHTEHFNENHDPQEPIVIESYISIEESLYDSVTEVTSNPSIQLSSYSVVSAMVQVGEVTEESLIYVLVNHEHPISDVAQTTINTGDIDTAESIPTQVMLTPILNERSTTRSYETVAGRSAKPSPTTSPWTLDTYVDISTNKVPMGNVLDTRTHISTTDTVLESHIDNVVDGKATFTPSSAQVQDPDGPIDAIQTNGNSNIIDLKAIPDSSDAKVQSESESSMKPSTHSIVVNIGHIETNPSVADNIHIHESNGVTFHNSESSLHHNNVKDDHFILPDEDDFSHDDLVKLHAIHHTFHNSTLRRKSVSENKLENKSKIDADSVSMKSSDSTIAPVPDNDSHSLKPDSSKDYNNEREVPVPLDRDNGQEQASSAAAGKSKFNEDINMNQGILGKPHKNSFFSGPTTNRGRGLGPDH